MNDEQKNGRLASEDEIVAGLVARLPAPSYPVIVGPGDDCAVLASSQGWMLLKTDAMVEGQHFSSNEKMQRVGWKAIARVQSDFAAMGGCAEAFVVSVFLPGDGKMENWQALYDGMVAATQAHGGILCGGETSRSPQGAGLIISVAGTGRCSSPPVLRSGAKPGHLLCVTGVLGGSIAGHHLDFFPRVQEGIWLAESGVVHAMMDLSDGLAKDLPRLCAMSNVGALVDFHKLPCRDGCDGDGAMNDGEDYELLFTIASADRERLESAWAEKFPRVKLSIIGEIVDRSLGMNFAGGWDPFCQDRGNM